MFSAELIYFCIKKNISNLMVKLLGLIRKKKPQTPAPKLDPMVIAKYKNQLIKPPAYSPIITRLKEKKKDKKCKIRHNYFVDVTEFQQQILPDGMPKTTVWGYGGLIKDPITGKRKYFRNSPGATFEAVRGIPVTVKWINKLRGKHLFAVDPTIHWANPNKMPMDPPKPWPKFPPGFKKAQQPVPIVSHLHGGEVQSIFDGNPDAWFTSDHKKGPAYVTSTYNYPNEQEPATIWYHDHAMGMTRLNVYAGLAGFYLIREGEKHLKDCSKKEIKLILPSGKYEIPIAIQDRMFRTDGSLLYNEVGNNPDIHPYWVPEFFGDVIMVNGKVWPNLDVDRRQYRFRLLNGSSSRFYHLTMSNGMKFIQIGSDGGFLPAPFETDNLLLAPAERADILVDFSNINPGTSIILKNDAKAPYPGGDDPDPNTTGQIMQFTVPVNAPGPVKPLKLPDKLNCITELKPDAPKRVLTLNELLAPNGTPIQVLLNGQMYTAPISELPRVGSTEIWEIVNLTMDTHPIHLHLVQFQLLNRQDFDAMAYMSEWEEKNGMLPLMHPTVVVPADPYLQGSPIEPDDNENGWKDTFRMNPNQVTRILVRFAPQDVPTSGVKPGENLYPFDPTVGPGYVWHCHIIDHEDNEMMRPYKVKS